jgi:5-methylcytosine-specific restriction endonuclease McrA
MSRRSIPESTKQELFARQFGCCNNRPDTLVPGFNIPGKGRYICPLWKLVGEQRGKFDESGYEADHILEHSIGGTDLIENLQLICPCCHSVKTKLFTRQPRSSMPYTSQERSEGVATMEELNRPVQNRNKRQRYDDMDLSFGKMESEISYLKRIKK